MTLTIGETRPYGETGLDRVRWATIPPAWVHWHQLTTTQRGVWIDALLNPGPSHSGDLYPHVVAWDGRLYVEDGHTRITRSLLQGRTAGFARIYRLNPGIEVTACGSCSPPSSSSPSAGSATASPSA